ncbi:hypothetical protein [Actinomadura macra]|uniref:hypothetical protein n=1 Tax=Actinomadura macra TaxID=46164 RepID=UPI000A52A5D1|nr:hypothetical protein [Actinomadura macra]
MTRYEVHFGRANAGLAARELPEPTDMDTPAHAEAVATQAPARRFAVAVRALGARPGTRTGPA